MTLKADLGLTFAIQLGGIDDGVTNCIGSGVSGAGRFDVRAAGPVASLAIDPLGDSFSEQRLAAI